MAEDGARPSSDSNRNSWVMSSTPASAIPFLRDEEVATSAHGITVALALAEPVVYLPHFDPADTRSVMLSGHLRLRLTRTVKIKKVELVFKGVAQKKIPNGILPKKSQVQNVKELNKHVWPVFLAGAHEGLSMSNIEYNANNFKFASPQFATINHNHNNKEAMDFSLQANFKHACGIGNCEPWARGVSRLHRGYKLFPPGDYTYDFEQLIDSHNPETIENEIISVRWLLQAVVEHSGAFQSNLSGIRYIPFIRSPVGECLEQVEPVAISRDWKDKLHYNITIFGKSFPLGSQIPIAIKLIPFAKITCRRIQVWVLENLHFHGRANHHVEPRKRFLLFEKTAHSASSNNYSGNSTRVTAGGGIPWNDRAAAIAGEEFVDHNRNNLLGDLSDGCQAGPIEMELNVQIPNCQSIKGKDEMQKLRCDATYESIEISHRIMITMYMSTVYEKEPANWHHFAITVHCPIRILSCLAAQSYIDLPAYSSCTNYPIVSQVHECGCTRAAAVRRNPPIPDLVSPANTYSASDAASFTALSVSSMLGFVEHPQQSKQRLYKY